jgi:hypothetical protein
LAMFAGLQRLVLVHILTIKAMQNYFS